MQAILLADEPRRELTRFCGSACAALLPVASKPVIAHALDDLADARIEEVFVFAGPQRQAVSDALGDGKRWGLTLKYMDDDATEDRPWLRLGTRLRAPFVVIRGDVLRSAATAQLCRIAEQQGERDLTVTVDGRSAHLELRRQLDAASPPTRIELPGTNFSPLATWREYHRACLDAAAGRFRGLQVAGRRIERNLTVGHQATLLSKYPADKLLWVGERSVLNRRTSYRGEVVIEADVVIDDGTELENTVVLPGSYVGKNLTLTNAIVAGSTLIRVDHDTVIRLDDRRLCKAL